MSSGQDLGGALLFKDRARRETGGEAQGPWDGTRALCVGAKQRGYGNLESLGGDSGCEDRLMDGNIRTLSALSFLFCFVSTSF